MSKFEITGWLSVACLVVWLLSDAPKGKKSDSDLRPRAVGRVETGLVPVPAQRVVQKKSGDNESATSLSSGASPIVVERMISIREASPMEYSEIANMLREANVNSGSVGVIAPRVYGDLARLAQFEDIRSTYVDRLTNSAAIEATTKSEEQNLAARTYREMQLKRINLWDDIVSNQVRIARERIVSEAGVTMAEVLNRLIAIRPNGPLPDMHLTNGIVREY